MQQGLISFPREEERGHPWCSFFSFNGASFHLHGHEEERGTSTVSIHHSHKARKPTAVGGGQVQCSLARNSEVRIISVQSQVIFLSRLSLYLWFVNGSMVSMLDLGWASSSFVFPGLPGSMPPSDCVILSSNGFCLLLSPARARVSPVNAGISSPSFLPSSGPLPSGTACPFFPVVPCWCEQGAQQL